MVKQISKREKIVDVASKLFSKYGFDKAVLDEIAKECGITKPAIYYHFKDKQTLYESVLCRKFSLISKKIEENTQKDCPKESLKAYIETFGYYLIEDKYFGAIFARELANGAKSIPQKCIENLSLILNRLDEILTEGKESGYFKNENPFMIQLMIVSTLINYQTSSTLREAVREHLDMNKTHINPKLEDIIPNLSEKILKALIC